MHRDDDLVVISWTRRSDGAPCSTVVPLGTQEVWLRFTPSGLLETRWNVRRHPRPTLVDIVVFVAGAVYIAATLYAVVRCS